VTNHLKRYALLFDGSRGLLGASVVISIAQSACLVLIPLVIRHVFDTDLHRGDASGVAVGGAVVLALDFVSSGLALWTRFMVLKATKRAIARLRYALLAKIYALPQSFHDRRESGEIHGTIVQDSERLDVVANAALGQMLPAAIVALGLMGVALALDPLLFALLVVAVPGMVMVKQRLGGTLREWTRTWRDAFNRFSLQTHLSLRTRTLAEVRAAEEVELERGRAQVEELSAAGLEMAWRQGALSIAQGALLAAAAVLVLVVGGRAVAQKHMTTGDLLSFYAVVALLVGQVSTLTTAIPTVISGHESLDRVNAFLDVDDPPPYRGSRRIAFRGGIELRHVTFGYGEEPLLREFELSIAPEEHVVILGPNGAGKSTLASLILGLYHPWSGELLADGIPYDVLDMRDLRSAFGVVLQDPVILPGTVAENIAYGRPAATSYDIEQAAEMAGVAEFIDRLPGGYAARVGQEGALVSGGQRQRIAIARALLGSPRLLILDEPTTHLDDAAIAAFQATLASQPRRPTVITITHDEVLAREADRVVSLRGGRTLPAGEMTTRPLM
jgi:ABC-type bacteriocin/lantibiotic exporter with double-glycine peptidase domain